MTAPFEPHFRVGLVFAGSTFDESRVHQLSAFVREIDERTREVRNGAPVTLVPFVLSQDQRVVAEAVAAVSKPLEAAMWTQSGVVFMGLDRMTAFAAVLPDQEFTLRCALEAVATVSHVVLIVCSTVADADRVSVIIDAASNTWLLLALISVQDDTKRFLEVGSTVRPLALADWLHAVKRRWQIPRPSVDALPKTKRPVLGLLFPWLTTAIIRQRFHIVRSRPRDTRVRCRESLGVSETSMEMLERADQERLRRQMDRICPFFTRHDHMGSYYSNVFRTSCLLVPVLIALSTMLAVVAIINVSNHNLWHVVELLLLVTAGALVLRARLAAHHAKWVENRLITELLRTSLLSSLLHTCPRVSVPTEEPHVWTLQTERLWTYLRDLPVMTFTTPPDRLLSARRLAVAGFAAAQEAFHRRFAEQHLAAQRWLVKVSAWAFRITLCVVLVQLVIAVVAESHEGLATALMLITLLCAVGAFVVSLLAHQLGFEAIAERSTNAAEHYRTLLTAIETSAATADARQVGLWARNCLTTYLAEQHSWYRHIPLLRLEI